MQMVCKEY